MQNENKSNKHLHFYLIYKERPGSDYQAFSLYVSVGCPCCLCYSPCTRIARIALSTASTMTPTSANMASHMPAMPNAPSIRQAPFTPSEKMMFSQTIPRH